MTDSRSTENAAPGGTCAAAGSALAHEIATALLTVQELDGPLECDRAQMMCSYGHGNETEHGGRNKQSIVREIDAVLARHGIGVPNAGSDASASSPIASTGLVGRQL